MITAPVALPFFGNLPAMFIDGSVTFYFNLVIACVLGLSLYKCADRLGISTSRACPFDEKGDRQECLSYFFSRPNRP